MIEPRRQNHYEECPVGLYRETTFKTSPKYCTPVPNRIDTICWNQRTSGWMDGQLAKNSLYILPFQPKSPKFSKDSI